MLQNGIRINAVLPGPTDTPLARANADIWLAFAPALFWLPWLLLLAAALGGRIRSNGHVLRRRGTRSREPRADDKRAGDASLLEERTSVETHRILLPDEVTGTIAEVRGRRHYAPRRPDIDRRVSPGGRRRAVAMRRIFVRQKRAIVRRISLGSRPLKGERP